MTPREPPAASRAATDVDRSGGRPLFLRHLSVSREQGRSFLLEHEAAEVCRAYGIPSPDSGLALDRAQAIAFAEKLGYPVVLKVVSPQVLHKSDVGGVRTGIASRAHVEEAYDSILETVSRRQPDAQIAGVTVAKMAGSGIETIVGLKRDDTFGPVVMFGIGGVNVEVYGDVTFRLCPIDRLTAEEMLSDIKARLLLEGFRGTPRANRAAVADIIVAVCRMGVDNPEIASLDLNPVRVDSDRAVALDTRILVR
jgi:acetyl-CoA synthetase (ADP-forming)